MKNVAIINSMPIKSTGLISQNLYAKLATSGYNPLFCYAHGSDEDAVNFQFKYKFSKKKEYQIHKCLAYITGLQGYYSYFATIRLLKKLKKCNIDTVYILNIHEWIINERLLFNYLGKNGISVVYIMIDEYPFLGRCCFSLGCTRFKEGCGHCPSIDRYPNTLFFDRSRKIYKMKKMSYDNVRKIVFVSPEPQILLASESPMMRNHKLVVLDEAVNLKIYKPSDTKELRESLGIAQNKIIIMGAAPFSDPRKGCQYILDAANILKSDERFVFVHVGFDTPKIKVPDNFIPVSYVSNQTLYAKYLSLADLLVFPSFADTLSNTCIAALACGTPLLCFNISGMPYLGNDEVLTLVEPRDIDGLVKVIRSTPQKDVQIINTCRKYAEYRYDSEKYSEKLIEIANSL